MTLKYFTVSDRIEKVEYDGRTWISEHPSLWHVYDHQNWTLHLNDSDFPFFSVSYRPAQTPLTDNKKR